jgi:hypothetical protein
MTLSLPRWTPHDAEILLIDRHQSARTCPRGVSRTRARFRPWSEHSQALSEEGAFVRYDGEGRSPVTDVAFAETKDLIAGWMVIDVEPYERALELAGELSAPPGAGGKPIHEWLEVRPFLATPPTITK